MSSNGNGIFVSRVRLADCLFQDSRQTGLFSWRINQKGSGFCGSSLNPNVKNGTMIGSKRSTVNMAAQSVSRLLDGNCSVVVSGTKWEYTYMEYLSKTTGEILQMALMFVNGKMGIWASTDMPDDLKQQRGLTMLVAAILFNTDLRNNPFFTDYLGGADAEAAIKDMVAQYAEIVSAWKQVQPPAAPSCVPIFCDAMYYMLTNRKGDLIVDFYTGDFPDGEFGQFNPELHGDEMELEHVFGPEPGLLKIGTEEKKDADITADLSNVPVDKLPRKKGGRIDYAILRKEPLSTFETRARAGQFMLPIELPSGVEAPPLYVMDDFFFTERFRRMFLNVHGEAMAMIEDMEGKDLSDPNVVRYQVIKSNPINIRFVGDPGTGKSFSAEVFAAMCGLPIGMLNCTSTMEEGSIQGDNRFVNGKIQLILNKASQLLAGYGVCLYEEYNLPKPGIIAGAMNDLLEGGVLMVDGYRPVQRHPLSICIFTQNVDTAGTNEVNEAVASRLAETYVIEDPSKEEFVNSLAHKGYTKKACGKIYTVYSRMKNYLRKENPDMVKLVTRRQCQKALRLMDVSGCSLNEAVEDTFVSSIYCVDKEIAEELQKLIQSWV